MECSICNTQLEGDFCSSCGQRYRPGRLGFLGLVTTFLSGWISLERGFFATLWVLIRQPQTVIINFWNGFRGYYSSPGVFLFYSIFVMGLHWNLVDNTLLGLTVNTNGLSEDIRQLFSPQFFVILLIVPVFALSAFLVHFKDGHNLAECFVASIYLFGVWTIVFTILSDLYFWWKGYGLGFSSFAAMMLVGSAMAYRQPMGLWAIAKSFVLQFLAMFAILLLFFGALYLIDPESVQVE